MQQFELTVTAAGEIRDADGRLVETVDSVPQTVQVSAAELASFTDDQLRAAGLDESTINQIRSTTP